LVANHSNTNQRKFVAKYSGKLIMGCLCSKKSDSRRIQPKPRAVVLTRGITIKRNKPPGPSAAKQFLTFEGIASTIKNKASRSCQIPINSSRNNPKSEGDINILKKSRHRFDSDMKMKSHKEIYSNGMSMGYQIEDLDKSPDIQTTRRNLKGHSPDDFPLSDCGLPLSDRSALGLYQRSYSSGKNIPFY
jgi:hypothetical protein